MSTRKSFLPVSVFFVLGAGVLLGAEKKIVSLGTHIYGPKLTMEDLKGHVVVFEKWGMR